MPRQLTSNLRRHISAAMTSATKASTAVTARQMAMPVSHRMLKRIGRQQAERRVLKAAIMAVAAAAAMAQAVRVPLRWQE